MGMRRAGRSRAFAGAVNLSKGLRYEITPFQGWIGLGALFPGRCPGLSQGAPLGRGGYGRSLCGPWRGGPCPNAVRRDRCINGPGVGRNTARRRDAPMESRLPQRGKTVGCTNGSGVGRNAAKGDSPGQRPGNKASQTQFSPERAKHKPIPHNTPAQTPPHPRPAPRAPTGRPVIARGNAPTNGVPPPPQRGVMCGIAPYFALSGLGWFGGAIPGALPRAVAGRPVGARGRWRFGSERASGWGETGHLAEDGFRGGE